MAYFAVTYVYDPAQSTLMDEVRPKHRAFLTQLKDDGFNVASGPVTGDHPTALLIFEAENADKVESLLDEDPFKKAGVILECIIGEWNPVINRF